MANWMYAFEKQMFLQAPRTFYLCALCRREIVEQRESRAEKRWWVMVQSRSGEDEKKLEGALNEEEEW